MRTAIELTLVEASLKATAVNNRIASPPTQIPLFWYFGVVGGVLLATLLIAHAYLAVDRIDAGINTVSNPPRILIRSSKKWPERIVFDTNVPTTVAVIPSEPVIASDSAVASSLPAPSSINSMAQLTSSHPVRAAARAPVVKPKLVKMPRLSQPRFAYLQKARRYPDFFDNWW